MWLNEANNYEPLKLHLIKNLRTWLSSVGRKITKGNYRGWFMLSKCIELHVRFNNQNNNRNTLALKSNYPPLVFFARKGCDVA